MLNKLFSILPLVAVASLAYYSLQETKPVSLLSENKGRNIPPNLTEYDVVPGSVYDGDTLRVRSPKGEILKIRFACIDAPELKQPMGEESRNHLRSLLNRGGNKIKVEPITVDRYGRTVAQLWNSYGLLQSQMAISGMAYGYDQYKKDCPNWSAVQSTESQAQKERLGVWSLPNGGERPWDYRKSKR